MATVARQVGYGTAFALSAAFKRVRGISPQEWRTGAAAGDDRPVAPGLPRTVVLPGA